MVRITLLCMVLVTLPAFAADPLAGLEEDVAKALKANGVPGIGVAVVKDGKVILCRGFGVKRIDKADPVTDHTLFAIGSVSKSFTACMIAMLVDEGTMEWDDPLRVHLPSFRMSDRFYSDEVTIRDCLCHRVGLPRNELVWYGSPFDRDEVLFRVRQMKLEAKIRTRFIYNNILYLASGQGAAKACGKSWDEFIAERIFKPLGMTTANTSITKFSKDCDKATPYTKQKGKPVEVAWRNADNMGPAGSINASAADMAEYVKFQLARGKAGDKRLINRDNFKVMHTPLVLLPKGPVELNPDAKLRAYGLGWMISDFRGHTLVEHGGNIDGMTAQVAMLPDQRMGVVVLANCNASLLPMTLSFDILDRLLGNEPQHLAETMSMLSALSEFGLQTATEPVEATRVKGTKPSFELEKYVGKYQDSLHPSMLVTLKDGKLTADFNTFQFNLEHWHYDTFVGTDATHTLPKTLVTFDQSADAGVAAIRFKPLVTEEFRFKKVSDRPKR